MRWLLLIVINATLLAQSYSEIMEDVDNSPTLKSAKEILSMRRWVRNETSSAHCG